MKRKKLICKTVLGIMLSFVLVSGTPVSALPGLREVPVFSDLSMTAEAASSCYVIENGTMTLMNKVNATKIKELKNKDQITRIVALDGVKLPESCANLFANYTNVTSIDLSKANTSGVKSMKNMFKDLENLVELNISGFDTSKVTNMQGMFRNCRVLTKVDVSGFNTSKVTDMSFMFCDCQDLKELDLSSFDTRKVTTMHCMFDTCADIKYLDLSHFNTSNVTDMFGLFSYMYSLEEVDLSGFDTANVTNMSIMFAYCKKLKSLNLSSFSTSNVITMIGMFEYTESLEELDLSSFKTGKLANAASMFMFSGVRKLNLSSFNTANLTNKDHMLSSCDVGILILGPKFKKVPEKMCLKNGEYGWAQGSADSDKISGDGNFAIISNSGLNTYYKIGKLEGSIEMFGSPVYNEWLQANVHLDECPRSSLQYKWYRDKQLISGATEDRYCVGKEDIGKTITCIVSDKYGIYKGSLECSTDRKVEKISGVSSPKNLTSQATSKEGAADGKIFGVDANMEYDIDRSFSNAKSCTSNTISNLKAGIYYIRYRETETHKAGYSTYIRVEEGKAEPDNDDTPNRVDVTWKFTDVKKDAWYVSAVQFVYDKDIMVGLSDTKFGTDQALTREQFGMILYKIEDKPNVQFKKIFDDVKSEKDWYAKAVIWAYNNKITEGVGNGRFGTGEIITREQLTTMLYKYARIKELDCSATGNALSAFADRNKVSAWAKEGMAWAVSHGLISGKAKETGNILDPSGKASRAECAQIIKSFYNNVYTGH